MDRHTAYIYEDEGELAKEVAGFLEAGTTGGEAAIMIATPTRITQVRDRLSSPCVSIDAQDMLDSFMQDGWPDATRFRVAVGGALSQAARSGNGKVRAYGEMVAVLGNRGHWDAAVRVEQLWNRLFTEHHVTLLCTYSSRSFLGAPADTQRILCTEHGKVLPGVAVRAAEHPGIVASRASESRLHETASW